MPKILEDFVGWRGLRDAVVDAFDGVNLNLTSTGDWVRVFGSGVIGENGTLAYSTSSGISKDAWYLNTKGHYLGNRWVRCLLTIQNVTSVGGIFVSCVNAANPKNYIVIRARRSGANDEFSLVERYGGAEIATTIGTISPGGATWTVIVTLVGRRLKLDVNNGGLTYSTDLGGIPGLGPNAPAGLYYTGPALGAGLNNVEWDDFEVRLFPYS